MRVLAVIDSLEQGGAERSLVETLRAMQGVEVHLALLRRSDAGFEAAAKVAGFELHTVRGRLARRTFQLRQLVEEVRPDIVHASLWQSDLAARLACTGLRVPLVSSLVNDTYATERIRGYPLRRRAHVRVLQALDRLTARRVDRFHAVTESVAEHHVEHLGIDRSLIEVAWRGREHPSLPPRTEARRELGLEGTVLLAVGRQEAQKLHRVLVEALLAVRQAVPDARVVIVGREGTESERLRRRIAELGLTDVVWLTGQRSDVASFLAAADRFVLPSSHEGIAGALIEAMLAEVPVIASDLPGVREITCGGAVARLVPARDPVVLARAIIDDLEDDEAARTRAEAALTHAARSFTMEGAAEGLLGVYEHALESRAGTSRTS